MSTRPNSVSGSYAESTPNSITIAASHNERSFSEAGGVPSVSPLKRVQYMNRKRRTVLWLYKEDYEYLSAVAEHDMDSKNISMHRLVKALRSANVKSFLKVEEIFKRMPPPGKP
jgi:hypothetical protein